MSFSPRQRNYLIVSSPGAVKEVDCHIQKMENALHVLEKVQALADAPGSVIRLREAELKLLQQIEIARDFMQCALQSCNRTLLIEFFGGDRLGNASRTAKIRSIIEKAHFSAMYSDDPRVPGCLSACQSMECVFRDSHWGRALENARKDARKKREQEWLNKIKPMDDQEWVAKTQHAKQRERLAKEEREWLVKASHTEQQERLTKTWFAEEQKRLEKTQRVDEQEQVAKIRSSQPTEYLESLAKTFKRPQEQFSKTQLARGKERFAGTLDDEHKHLARTLAEKQEQLAKVQFVEEQEELVKTQLLEVEHDETGDGNRDADEEDDKNTELATMLRNLEKYEAEQSMANKINIPQDALQVPAVVKLASKVEAVSSKHRDCFIFTAIFQWSLVNCFYRQISQWV